MMKYSLWSVLSGLVVFGLYALYHLGWPFSFSEITGGWTLLALVVGAFLVLDGSRFSPPQEVIEFIVLALIWALSFAAGAYIASMFFAVVISFSAYRLRARQTELPHLSYALSLVMPAVGMGLAIELASRDKWITAMMVTGTASLLSLLVGLVTHVTTRHHEKQQASA